MADEKPADQKPDSEENNDSADRSRGDDEPKSGTDSQNDDSSQQDGDSGESSVSDDVDEDDPKVKKQKKIVIVSLVVVAIIAVIVGVVWWLNARHWEKTDDAFIDAQITHLAPRGSGSVVGVYVGDNQRVRAGQLLVQLDDTNARTQLAQAEASKEDALAQLKQARANIVVADSQVDQAVADTRAPAAQAAKSSRDYERYLRVRSATPAAVAEQQLDQSRATAISDAAQFASSRQQVRTAKAQVGANRSRIDAALAQLRTAEAQIEQARVQIGYARVVAPVDGHVANKRVAPGNYAQAGQELLAVVPDKLWITANFKETQLAHMRVGQRVEIEVDAYPDMKLEGHVDSIQRGAGQAFQVLPAQNATGNFVKVVQRVPVKIVIDHVEAVRVPLGPGMSVLPRVRID